LLPKLVRGVAVDALDSDGRQPTASRYSSPKSSDLDDEVRAQQFIVAVSLASGQMRAALGLGEDVRLSAAGLTGAGLIVDQRVVHLAAFALE
jgi:hypothetical protein